MAPPRKTPVWKGSAEIYEQSGSPDWVIDEKGVRIQRSYEGPYTAVRAEITSGRITRGKVMPDLGSGFPNYPIKSFRFNPGEGGSGILTVTLDNYTGPSTSFANGAEGEPSYEEEWVELEKPLRQHPTFADLDDDTFATIEEAVQNPVEGPSPALTEPAATELYTRLLRGQDSYTLYVPVIRATTPYGALPPKGGAGQIANPPGEANAPDGWVWRKTAHRRMDPGQESRYELVEEWTAAEEWDDYIYGSESGLPGT